MSTSLLYHGFGIVGYNYVRTDHQEGDVIFTVSRKKFNLRCPACKSKRIIKHGSLPRWFHTLPIGKKAIYIKTEVHTSVMRELYRIKACSANESFFARLSILLLF